MSDPAEAQIVHVICMDGDDEVLRFRGRVDRLPRVGDAYELVSSELGTRPTVYVIDEIADIVDDDGARIRYLRAAVTRR